MSYHLPTNLQNKTTRLSVPPSPPSSAQSLAKYLSISLKSKWMEQNPFLEEVTGRTIQEWQREQLIEAQKALTTRCRSVNLSQTSSQVTRSGSLQCTMSQTPLHQSSLHQGFPLPPSTHLIKIPQFAKQEQRPFTNSLLTPEVQTRL